MIHPLTKKRLWFAGALLCILAGRITQAQLAVGVTEGFEVNEYHPAPNGTQLKWRITGDKFEPRDPGPGLLTGMRLQMFTRNGGRELEVAAPQCLYDSAKRSASSPGRLKVAVGDNQFVLEGEGFLWQQTQNTNWTLTISNQVRSTVQRPTTNANAVPMIITSQQFAFDTLKHEGVFRGTVRAEDPEIALGCEVLTAATTSTNGTPDTLTAERNVTVIGKADQLTANADHAFFARTNETLTLSGNVTWKQGEQTGSAGRIVLRRLEKEFTADGKVAVKLPGSSFGFGGLLQGETNAPTAKPKPSAPVNLFADHLLVRSNLTVIEGGVRIADATNRLACDKLVVQTSGAEQTTVAEGNVVVCHGSADNCLRADRVVHTKSTGAAVFTGQPSWKLAQTEGRANQVTVRATGEIHAVGDVAARVMLAGQSNSFLNVFPGPSNTNQSARVFELFARELKATQRQVSLLGGARVHQSPLTGSEPHLSCETLELLFATNSSHVELMRATNQVRFEQGIVGTTNGPNAYGLLTARGLTATCDPTNGALALLVAEGAVRAEQPGSVAQGERAVYTAATDTLELTGQPVLRAPGANVTGAERIIWNRKSNHVSATGVFDGTAQSSQLKQVLAPPKPTPP